MKTRVWKYYDRTMDGIAMILFPVNKPTRFWIGNHQLHATEITLAIYTLLIGVGLSLVFDNWLWFPATVLCMVMAAMMYRMMYGDP
jgi:hypothetical protein